MKNNLIKKMMSRRGSNFSKSSKGSRGSSSVDTNYTLSDVAMSLPVREEQVDDCKDAFAVFVDSEGEC